MRKQYLVTIDTDHADPEEVLMDLGGYGGGDNKVFIQDYAPTELESLAINRLRNVKELYRALYRAEHMHKYEDYGPILDAVGADLERLRGDARAWGFQVEQEYFDSIKKEG